MPSVPSDHDFTWRDGERTVVFRRGRPRQRAELLAEGSGSASSSLTTPRALGGAPLELAERASAVHEVPRGPVPDAAAAIIDSVRNPTLVALGGGRVIDTAKAIAAVRGGRGLRAADHALRGRDDGHPPAPGRPRARGAGTSSARPW